MKPLSLLVGLLLLGASGDGARLSLPLSVEKLTFSDGSPAPAYETLSIAPQPDGRYALTLTPGADAPAASADLRAMVPGVPRLARGNADLTRIALIQREFNRNEVHNDLPGGRDFSIANNCLRQGLWEVKLTEKQADKSVMRYHAWLTFPKEDYARLFEAQTGLKYSDYENLFAFYPTLGGLPVPLPALRTVVSEKDAGPVNTHAADPLQRLPEQQSKTKWVLSPGIATYGDFSDPAKQPIALARFTEPGRYTAEEQAKFDLAWLAKPVRLQSRLVKNPRVEGPFPEIEISFADGKRILLADSRLAALPVLSDPPTKDADVLKLVCGIGTPDIHSPSAADRAREIAEDRPRYLMLLDRDGRHVDNHLVGGLDAAYLWRDATNLHLWLVSYERIAFVGHLSAPWTPPSANETSRVTPAPAAPRAVR